MLWLVDGGRGSGHGRCGFVNDAGRRVAATQGRGRRPAVAGHLHPKVLRVQRSSATSRVERHWHAGTARVPLSTLVILLTQITWHGLRRSVE